MLSSDEWQRYLATRLSALMFKNSLCIRVAFVNRKGGPGKSSNLVNIAGTLALRGHKVCIIDVDAQGGSHAGRLLGLEPEDGLFHALVGIPDGDHYVMLPTEEHLRAVPIDSYLAPLAGLDDDGNLVLYDIPPDESQGIGRIAVLPAGLHTLEIPWRLADERKFDAVLDDIARLGYNIILVDTGPSMSLFDGVVYEAMDAFVIVTELEALSLFAVSEVFPQIERASANRQARGFPPNRLLGIIPNKFRSLREHVDNLSELRATFGEKVWPPMRQLKTYSKMAKYGQTIPALASTSPEALEVVQLTNQFEREVEQWLIQSANR